MWMVGGAAALYMLSTYTDTQIRLYYQENSVSAAVLQSTPSLRTHYCATPWLGNGHLQSLYAISLGNWGDLRVDYTRELIKLKDNGTLSIDWASDSLENISKILVIFHGLTGGSEQMYVKVCVSSGISLGFRVCVMQMRGINGTPMTSCKLPNAGMSGDIEEGLEVIQGRYPQAEIVGIGMSMGANLVLKYAGERKEKCVLKGIVAISCPFDLLQCCQTLRKFQYRLSDKILTRNLQTLLQANSHIMQELDGVNGINITEVQAADSVYDFDELLTRRALGLGSVEEYYETSSCTRVLGGIRVPVLAISAMDDPVTT